MSKMFHFAQIFSENDLFNGLCTEIYIFVWNMMVLEIKIAVKP